MLDSKSVDHSSFSGILATEKMKYNNKSCNKAQKWLERVIWSSNKTFFYWIQWVSRVFWQIVLICKLSKYFKENRKKMSLFFSCSVFQSSLQTQKLGASVWAPTLWTFSKSTKKSFCGNFFLGAAEVKYDLCGYIESILCWIQKCNSWRKSTPCRFVHPKYGLVSRFRLLKACMIASMGIQVFTILDGEKRT